MKTITMPLEEYQKELNFHRKTGYDEGYEEGALTVCTRIIWDSQHSGHVAEIFKSSTIEKRVVQTISILKEYYKKLNFVIREIEK